MQLTLLSPRKSLNKAYLKVKPSRSEIELFKTNLIKLLDGLDESESEEHVKNDLSDFLKNTFFQRFYINTKGRNDLVIHNGPDAKSFPGVLIEAKKPSNKSEMIRPDNLNAKAFLELILYYLRERITGHNLEIKHLVATNIYEWYIFDASLFEKMFAQNKTLVQQFTNFEEGRLSGNTTDFFYKEIAEPFVASIDTEFFFTWFDFREYDKPLRNEDKKDDSKLIALYKLLSPEHLLNLPFLNDSNTLDKTFYSELLHIIGLTETKSGSKKIIERKKEGQRDPGSLLENTILQLDTRDKISRLPKPALFGETYAERLFTVSLELVITWLNRILFLKLLEAQLIRYHNGDSEYGFMNTERINGYDDLDNLFFRVLARKAEERDPEMAKLFSKIPYLNSSLFEPTELEQLTIFISNLQDHALLPIISSTVLKDNTSKKCTGKLSGLQYLFEFLDAYDFAGEGSEDIQEDNKTLINASVLGLIFEKINGYKDGSFFTPGFITMYMCRETIRSAVVHKFNDAKGWNCETIDHLYDKIEDRPEANRIINSLKICDPAVGSGHFLVSALNEIIAIKSDLKILTDREGRRLKEYRVEVANDELVVTDEEGDLFEYMPGNNESQRIQEALFYEKQTIIENCLFGVDINPNSVKICRLRLWIELLKNAYYKPGSSFTELETLPNIDINIKCGNSLISRYSLDADIKQALKKSKWSIDSYRLAVMSYRNATNKEEKRTMERLIESIKTDFETEVAANDKRLLQLKKLNGDLFNLTQQTSLFERTKKELADWNKQVNELTGKIKKLEIELEEIKNNKIYENAFEWRFEFPEVLNDEGEFVGFDVVIGNPPYGVNFNKKSGQQYENLFQTFNWRGESYTIFIERAVNLMRHEGQFGFIIPDTLLNLGFTEAIRTYLLQNVAIHEIDLLPSLVFPGATVNTILLFFAKQNSGIGIEHNEVIVKSFRNLSLIKDLETPQRVFNIDPTNWQNSKSFNIQSDSSEIQLIQRIDAKFQSLGEFCDMFSGIKVYEVGKGNPPQTSEILNSKPFTAKVRKNESWLPLFDGKHIGFYELLWQEDNWIDYGEWLAAPREKQNFDSEKILIRKITGSRIIAHYIPYTSYCNTLLFVLKIRPEQALVNYKTLLGILNSGFLGWYFRKKFQINEEDTFPQIMIRDILQFAIPNVYDERTKKIEHLVDEIISVKQNTQSADTILLETEIDRLVYELYGLTEEETKIVERN
jgi:adenine-specific DNA-methyltransferase